jgi:hypothetical protein
VLLDLAVVGVRRAQGALGNWVNADRRRRGDGNGALSEDERADLAMGGVMSSSAVSSLRCPCFSAAQYRPEVT